MSGYLFKNLKRNTLELASNKTADRQFYLKSLWLLLEMYEEILF